MVLSIGLTALAVWLVQKFISVAIWILGGIAGWMAGTLIYELVIMAYVQNPYIMFGTCGIFALIGVIASYKYRDDLVITSTALLGAYGFFRGISLFAGGFPNEITLY